MTMWREGGGKESPRSTRENLRVRELREREREEGLSSPLYSRPGLPGCCQVTVGRGIPGCCQVTVGWSLDRILTLFTTFKVLICGNNLGQPRCLMMRKYENVASIYYKKIFHP